MFDHHYSDSFPLNCLIGGSSADSRNERDIFLVPLMGSPAGPLGSLIGYCGPLDWDVVQVKLTVDADATTLTAEGVTTSHRAQGVLTLNASRCGRATAELEVSGHTLAVENVDHVEDQLDVLRRILGCPTSPTHPQFQDFVELVWMDQVLRNSIGEAAERSVLNSRLAADFRRQSPLIDSAFPTHLQGLGSWSALHDVLSDPFLSNVESFRSLSELTPLNAAQIAWMDTPMFARTLTKSLPTRDEGLALLLELGVDCQNWATNVHTA